MNQYLIAFIKSIFTFVFLLLMTRLMGRKQLSQITFFDYIVGITIGSISANFITQDKANFWEGAIYLLVWSILPIMAGYLALKSLHFHRLVDGEPLVIIQRGTILTKKMNKARYNIEDLLMQLREKDVFDISEVEFAVLETDGTLSVLKKPPAAPVTPKDLKIITENKQPMLDLILNSKIIESNLKTVNRDTSWLINELNARNVSDINDIVYTGLMPDGQLYIATKCK